MMPYNAIARKACTECTNLLKCTLLLWICIAYGGRRALSANYTPNIASYIWFTFTTSLKSCYICQGYLCFRVSQWQTVTCHSLVILCAKEFNDEWSKLKRSLFWPVAAHCLKQVRGKSLRSDLIQLRPDKMVTSVFCLLSSNNYCKMYTWDT